MHRITYREIFQEATIERVSPGCLNGSETRHMANQRKLICLPEGLPNSRGIPEITSGEHNPIRSLPAKLLHYLKTNGFLAFDTKGIEGVKQVNTRLIAHLLNKAHGVIEVAIDLDCCCSIG